MAKKIVILNQIIQPGKSYQLNLDVARLHTRTKLEVPIIIHRGKKDGPTVLISAGIHGDEVNGVEIVRQIVANKYNVVEAGMTICVPVLNIFGYLIKSRYFPDGRDLNRAFPGQKSGSLASKVAYSFMNEIVVHADICIDFHTGAQSRFNFSQLRISDGDPELVQLAGVFGAKFVKFATEREKSFRESATKIGKKVILFEGGKAMDFDREVTTIGVNGVLNILRFLEMRMAPRAADYKPRDTEQIQFTNSQWVRSKHSGSYRSFVRNGHYIRKGELIGSVTDPYGFFEKNVISPYEGYVICLNHSPLVNKGDAIAHIAVVHI